ncbi:DUF2946 family protein [Brucella sp. 21LCYQ03]|nr:DUF2946 family protein [Brucella sp. 21LCYQ03]
MTLLVAFFVIVQALFGSYVISAQAAPDNRDFYGNVICFGGAHAPDDSSDSQKHIPDCCNLGCGMFAASLEARIAASGASPRIQSSALRYFVDLRIFFPGPILFGISLPRAPPLSGQV